MQVSANNIKKLSTDMLRLRYLFYI